jgi:hypothetical protein
VDLLVLLSMQGCPPPPTKKTVPFGKKKGSMFAPLGMCEAGENGPWADGDMSADNELTADGSLVQGPSSGLPLVPAQVVPGTTGPRDDEQFPHWKQPGGAVLLLGCIPSPM